MNPPTPPRSWTCSRCGSRYPNLSCYVCDETPEPEDESEEAKEQESDEGKENSL